MYEIECHLHFSLLPLSSYSGTPLNRRPRYNRKNISKLRRISEICGNKPRYNEPPRHNELILTVPTQNLPRYNEYFVLSLAVSKNDMTIQMVDKPNTTPIGQDRKTLAFKSLFYLHVAVHASL